MTQTGKCDVCRVRKVKCDEKKPNCSQCSKKDRPCVYTYGKLSAVVIEDPKQYTGHGKSLATPKVYPLRARKTTSIGSPQEDKLRITMEREAEKGGGLFLAFGPEERKIMRKDGKNDKEDFVSLKRNRTSSSISTISSPTELVRRLSSHYSSILLQPESPEFSLTARFIHMFSSCTLESNPFSILGSWITSIPSRLGFDPALYLAVQYAVDALQKYCTPGWEVERKANYSKSRALKSLAGALIEEAGKVVPRWELVLTTELHLSAEALKILMGPSSCYHTIHVSGLTEMLKAGCAEGMDEPHYWDLVHQAYIDEVSEAVLAGRISDFDNAFYLTSTSPLMLSSALPPLAPMCMATGLVMHSWIQIPRLGCLTRHAITFPHDAEILESAFSLAESLCSLDPAAAIAAVSESRTTVVSAPPCPSIADIVPTSLHFSSIQAAVLLTRYWMLRCCLCGMLQTLHKHFPSLYSASTLPDLGTVREADLDAAVKVAQSIPYAYSISPNLPLVQLRLLPAIQVSMGPWYRVVQRLESVDSRMLVNEEGLQLEQAWRMQNWIVEEGNRIHCLWDMAPVSVEMIQAAVDVISGEEIPGWLPRRVRFEEVGEEVVMKLEYEN